MIVVLGDIHFRSDKDYFRKTCEEFLSWFDTWECNRNGNSLILAGDLVETIVNGGIVFSYLEQFINSSRFDGVHICVGNHDLKKVNGFPQLAYEFYSQKENIHIYKEISEVVIDGRKVLMMPYYSNDNELGLSMKDYYSRVHENKSFKNDYDLVIGHFNGDDISFGSDSECIENLDKLSGRVILGHIHTRYINHERYIGSVFAGKKSENDYNRCAMILDDDGKWYEERLPIFNEFLEVYYPEKLCETKALVPIYTVLNCKDEKTARDLYGNICIKKTTMNLVDTPKKVDLEKTFSSVKEMSISQLYDRFVKERGSQYNDRVLEICRKALNTE